MFHYELRYGWVVLFVTNCHILTVWFSMFFYKFNIECLWLLIHLFNLNFNLSNWFLSFWLWRRLNFLILYYFWWIRPYFRFWYIWLLSIIKSIDTCISACFFLENNLLYRLFNFFSHYSFFWLWFKCLKEVINHCQCLIRYLLLVLFLLLLFNLLIYQSKRCICLYLLLIIW